ncbi:MAG: HAMP domain-containing histidine kinase [Saprospiraceae bacterium]|nr:HAMP domain-containing histidine kinase [Saprospiraceae bacterium]
MQIRARLTLMYLGISAGILAIVLFAAWWTYKQHTESDFFENLHAKAVLTAQTTLREVEKLPPLPINWIESEDLDTLPYRDNISVYNDAYERVFVGQPLAAPFPVKTLQLIQQAGRQQFRHLNLHAVGITMTSPSQRPFTVIAEGYYDPDELIHLRNILIVSFVCGVAVIAASGWYFAGQALRPVSKIMDQVNTLQPEDLSRRVETGARHDELARLSETFNRLLDRVEQAFLMQRMFLSNVSHELKNPLMAMRAQLDVTLQREREPAAYRQALQSVLDDLRELSEVEEKLLQLARIYNEPDSIPFEPVRLDELLWQAKEHLQKNYPAYKAIIDPGHMPESEETLLVFANEALLRTALINLMNNACKYSPDQRVLVRVQFQADGAHALEVIDNGPGITPEELPLIFEPFYRSSQHRMQVKGTGIGLSLVRSILLTHRIGLSIRQPASGGSVFQLKFPPFVEGTQMPNNQT